VGVDAGRIHTIGAEVKARRVIDLAGAIVAPGFIDMHVHCYEWVTNFGLPPDAAGVHSGATTIVDQGSTGAWTLGGFKAFIAVGDSNGHIGLGVKCSSEVANAIKGSLIAAKLAVVPIRRGYWGSRGGAASGLRKLQTCTPTSRRST
jgi:alpha-D-ribose 1-methylphosphonate 5-triphosphate diphosphatase PhnM